MNVVVKSKQSFQLPSKILLSTIPSFLLNVPTLVTQLNILQFHQDNLLNIFFELPQ